MSNGQENNLTSPDAFGIICARIKEKLSELGDFGELEFHCKLRKHNGLVTDAYLGHNTENGFVVTEHFRP